MKSNIQIADKIPEHSHTLVKVFISAGTVEK